MHPAVSLNGVEFSYGDRKALRGISFSVTAGQIAALLGPNGGGKTTTFKILSTLLKPQAGMARVFGTNVVGDPYAVRRQIGVVFQNRSLDLELTVRENLIHQGHLYGLSGAELHSRIGTLAGRFGIEDRLSDAVRNLSGGLQRRVDLAKALLNRPSLLLLDEPTNGLDPKVSRDFWDQLRALNDVDEVTILLTTHSLQEAEHCSRLVIVSDGQVITEGSPEELKQEVGPEVVTVQASSPEQLAKSIEDRFRIRATVVNATVRIEHDRGHDLVSRLMEAFEPSIESVTVSRATLEDVFIRRTGRTLG